MTAKLPLTVDPAPATPKRPINPCHVLTQACVRYARAAVADSWKGSAPVEDHDAVTQELDAASMQLSALIDRYVPES
jgi:hypothetical protein